MKLRILGALSIALSTSLAACSSSSTGEKTAASEAAIQVTRRSELTAGEWQFIFNTALDVPDTVISAANDKISIALSPKLASAMKQIDSTSTGTVIFPVPATRVNFPDPWSFGWGHLSSLALASIESTINGAITVHAVLNGTVHVNSPGGFPDVDLTLSRIDVWATLDASSDGSKLILEPLQVLVQKPTASCGLADWCSGLVESNLPDLSKGFANALNGSLQHVDLKSIGPAILEGWSNASIAPNDPHWQFMGHMSFGPMSLFWDELQIIPPTAPVGCAYGSSCVGTFIGCPAQGDAVSLQRRINGSWVDVGYQADGAIELFDSQASTAAQTNDYRVCAYNAAGTACTDVIEGPAPAPDFPGCWTGSGGGNNVKPGKRYGVQGPT
jgi:hypothetical protein